jgi:predicted nucleic acid-binding protein
MIVIDTSVLIDIVEDNPVWADWSQRRLEEAVLRDAIAINDVIYAELSVDYLDADLAALGLTLVPVPRPALFLAGKAFLRYREEGGTRTGVLPDFFIGAHAAVMGAPLVTRNARRYRRYFPRLDIIAPE